jgi:hypothetical protein
MRTVLRRWPQFQELSSRTSELSLSVLLAAQSALLGVTLLCALSVLAMSDPQAAPDTRPEIPQHIRELMKKLPADSLLRQQLVSGARGDGVRHP